MRYVLNKNDESALPVSRLFRSKRYLVTGGAGFIGSNLVRQLIASGASVVVVDNLSTGKAEHIPQSDFVQFVEGDIVSMDLASTVGYVDGIFHLAAMSKVMPSLGDPGMVDYCTQQNVLGTLNVLKYALQHSPPVKVVYSASSTYYGAHPPPQSEDAPPDLLSPYALSKYVGERYCELYSRQYGVPTVRLRYFMVYGPREPSSGSYAVVTGIFLRQFQQGLPLTIHGSGEQCRDFVHVDDVCEANVLAMKDASLVNDVINVGTGRMLSIKELAGIISNITVHTPPRSFDTPATQSDTSRMEALLRWRPTRDIESYLRDLVSEGRCGAGVDSLHCVHE